MTDSVLLYAPSQIALSAILSAASKVSSTLDSYVTDILFSRDRLGGIIEAVRSKISIHFLKLNYFVFFVNLSTYNK